jgi:hypothetical protein
MWKTDAEIIDEANPINLFEIVYGTAGEISVVHTSQVLMVLDRTSSPPETAARLWPVYERQQATSTLSHGSFSRH